MPADPAWRATNCHRRRGKHALRRQTDRIGRQNFVVCAANDDPAIHSRAIRRHAARRGGGARDADDGTIPRDQGRQSRAVAVLPDGRFLRAVLRGRRNRLARARHRADQARQASGHGYPDVRRAGGALRRLSASPDRARPPRRGVRADGGSGRGPGARQQERGAPRRGAAGDAGHADRRHAARRQDQQLSAGDGAGARIGGRRPHRARLDRHFHRGIHRHRMLDRRTRGDAVADQSQRGDRHRRAVWRSRSGAAAARIAGGDAADPRRVRQRHRRAAAVRLFRGRHHGRPQRDVAAGSDRRRRRRHLYRPHPGGQASAAVAAVARGRRHHHGDRSRHPRQSRTDADAGGRTARIAARCHRLHRDRRPDRGCWRNGWRRRSPTAPRSRGGSMRSRPSSRTPPRATISAPRCARRPTCRARWRDCRLGAAARATSPACATASSPPIRRWRGLRSSTIRRRRSRP